MPNNIEAGDSRAVSFNPNFFRFFPFLPSDAPINSAIGANEDTPATIEVQNTGLVIEDANKIQINCKALRRTLKKYDKGTLCISALIQIIIKQAKEETAMENARFRESHEEYERLRNAVAIARQDVHRTWDGSNLVLPESP